MTTVQKIIDRKTDIKVYTVPANATVLAALQTMDDANTGAVLVTENEKIVGIFTERDYARQGEIKGKFAKDTIVRDVMTSQMVMIRPETTLQECVELMRQYRVRHLPVIEQDRVVGVVAVPTAAREGFAVAIEAVAVRVG